MQYRPWFKVSLTGLTVSFLLMACGTSTPGTEDRDVDPNKATIQLNISGLAGGASAAVQVAGPEGSFSADASGVFPNLPPGDYQVKADPVQFHYEPVVSQAAFTLAAGESVAVDVSYQFQPEFNLIWPEEPVPVRLDGSNHFSIAFVTPADAGYVYELMPDADDGFDLALSMTASGARIEFTAGDVSVGSHEFSFTVRATGTDRQRSITVPVEVQAVVTDHGDAVPAQPGMLRHLLEDPRVAGGTITFDPDAFRPNSFIQLESELVIDQDVELIAAPLARDLYQVELRGSHTGGRILHVTEAVTVRLSGLALHQGSAATGGLILSSGHLTVEGSRLTGGDATDEGGAIASLAGTLNVHDSLVSDNNAGTHGAAIYFGADTDSTPGNLTIESSTLRNNASQGSGGAVYLGAGTAGISHSLLEDNRAQGQGGAIYSLGELVMEHSAVTGNNAPSGGGISSYNDLTVSFSSFTANQAVQSGGGIYHDANLDALAQLHVSRSVISANRSNGGGGIAVRGSVSIEDSEFYDNYARSSGGGLSAYVSTGQDPGAYTVTITGSTFARNRANEYMGGAISAGVALDVREQSRTLTINLFNSSIVNNHAGYHGGGLNLEQILQANLGGNTIVGNFGALHGGGIYAAAAAIRAGSNLFGRNQRGDDAIEDIHMTPSATFENVGANQFQQENMHQGNIIADPIGLAANLAMNGGRTRTLMPSHHQLYESEPTACSTEIFAASGQHLLDQRGERRAGVGQCTFGAVVLQSGEY